MLLVFPWFSGRLLCNLPTRTTTQWFISSQRRATSEAKQKMSTQCTHTPPRACICFAGWLSGYQQCSSRVEWGYASVFLPPNASTGFPSSVLVKPTPPSSPCSCEGCVALHCSSLSGLWGVFWSRLPAGRLRSACSVLDQESRHWRADTDAPALAVWCGLLRTLIYIYGIQRYYLLC